MVDKYGITHLYTAPTAIRSLMREGDEHVTKYARSSLKVLGSVGEPINPEAWKWYHEVRSLGQGGRYGVVEFFGQISGVGVCGGSRIYDGYVGSIKALRHLGQ